jgi:Flp pilus assembly protein protease CpaA
MEATIPKLLVVLALSMTFVAAIFDWRRGTIPPWVSLALLPVAPCLHAWALRGKQAPFGLSGPVFGALLSLVGAMLCALVPYLLFRFKWAGGGDVKVLASLGALLGPHWALPAEFYALVLAALYVPTRLAYQGRLFATMFESAVALVVPIVRRERHARAPDAALETVRLSPFVFGGAVISLALSSFHPGLVR